jgi:hypothetical protein
LTHCAEMSDSETNTCSPKEMSAAAAAILSNSALRCVQMGKTPQQFLDFSEDCSANTVNEFTFKNTVNSNTVFELFCTLKQHVAIF